MALYNLQINGRSYRADVEPDTPLLWVLRDHLGLVGTKYGCGIAQCGACTVHLNGEATRSCVLPVSAVGKGKVITIEGLSATAGAGTMHPVQKAWDTVDVPQCGYCQAGQIMTAAAFLKKTPKPTPAQIDDAMSGNICRCGTYHRIREAVQLAANTPASTPTSSTKKK
ncbi:(2Fe-2S)-binding protein [Fibrella arboris]|uniref:(2Fe-2S)-binding protein n=1 Tax=Fibrella arboris TaxID=3242486 RepID=UPI00351FA65E